MNPLRFLYVWLGLGLVLVAAVVAGSLAPSQPSVAHGSDKLIHAGTYLILAIWFCGIYRPSRYAAVAAALLALGAGLEFAQHLLAHRVMEFADMLANAFGVGAGVALSWWELGGWCSWVESRLGVRA